MRDARSIGGFPATTTTHHLSATAARREADADLAETHVGAVPKAVAGGCLPTLRGAGVRWGLFHAVHGLSVSI